MELIKLVDMEIVPVEAQFVELMVPLYSYGCGKKIKKALANFKGIYSVNVDYEQQKVTVWGICNKNEVLSTIRAKRKGARFWNSQDDDEGCISSQRAPSLRRTWTLNRHLPLNWKAAWKKVFTRSISF